MTVARTWNTALGPLATELRSLSDMNVGDVFVGPNLSDVYQVMVNAQSDPGGHPTTEMLTRPQGTDPLVRWECNPDTPMHYVVGGLPADTGRR